MKKEGSFAGTWQHDVGTIDVKLSFISFKEDNAEIIYCPALDISGYGRDLKEAAASFKISLGEFFQYSLNKNTFFSELQRLGWKIRKSRPMVPPDISKLLEQNDNFSRIFNNHDFHKYDQVLKVPAAC
jgi:hypothetical protein